jgi:hypothetical protein
MIMRARRIMRKTYKYGKDVTCIMVKLFTKRFYRKTEHP